MPTYSAYTPEQKLELINKARTVLRGEYMASQDLKKLMRELEINDQFTYATEILLKKMKEDEDQKINISVKDYQTLAKYIYKDNSLPSAFKFDKALQQLHAHLHLSETGDCETLGLAGAVYKRKWQYDHRFKNLVLSRFYYKQGYLQWRAFIKSKSKNDKDVRNDSGFTAINYAYMCELMATDKLEEFGEDTGFTKKMEEDLEEAVAARTFILKYFIGFSEGTSLFNMCNGNWLSTLRKRIVQYFISENYQDYPKLKNNKWAAATVAEALFGLGQYEEARQFIRQFVDDKTTQPWEIRTFNQQLLSIAYLQIIRRKFYNDYKALQQARQAKTGKDNDDKDYSSISDLEKHIAYVNDKKINECLNEFKTSTSGSGADVCNDSQRKNSRWGLALSGGGFRASLFHIGVLAALAEEDQLKNIEVLSCVSGGSIIGAYYYLKLKLLLESKTDCEIEKHDYINLVKEVETDFLNGVQKNLRMRIFSNLRKSIKIFSSKNYSRSHRLGELYEEHLYKSIFNGDSRYSELLQKNNGKIFMSDLFINPKLNPGEQFNFNNDNWLRKNKVPQLILNATSVNTGHNWQFTASFMGEPAGSIQADIDVKPRLRRMYYDDAPDEYKKFRLGYAVAASSGVPALFHPMPMYGLYPGIDLQLIDGGLHDNQGIGALLETECVNMIISDASGQLPTDTGAVNNDAAVFFRADNILQERLRELQFKDIKQRADTTQIASLITLHLKNGLQQDPISWWYCTDPPRVLYDIDDDIDNELTRYGVLRTVQKRLSEIRTDLDSFNDVEAYTLMYSGWSQTKLYYHPNCNMDECARNATGWKFLAAQPYVTNEKEAKRIDTLLSAGKYVPFKLWYLSKGIRNTIRAIKWFFILLGLGLLAWLAYLLLLNRNETISTKVTTIAWVLGVIVIALLSRLLANALNYKTHISNKLIRTFFAIVSFLVFWVYVNFFNPMYNKIGRMNK